MSQGGNIDVGGTAGVPGALTVDPLLGVLQDNGGYTPTHAITSFSIAYNAGVLAGAPATDQRSLSRDASPDIVAGHDVETAR